MENKVFVVTGGGSGIGAGLARRFAQEIDCVVVVSDLNLELAQKVVSSLGARSGGGLRSKAVQCDVSLESDVRALVRNTLSEFGRIDVFFSNAGIHFQGNGADGADKHTLAQWDKIMKVNVLSHVWAFQELLPHFRRQRQGRFLITASAARLLTNLGDVSYSTTKHAAVGLAELAIAHGDENIRVHCLCPQAVETAMFHAAGQNHPSAADGVLSPDQVADCVAEAFANEHFLILPHKQVAKYISIKSRDYEKWILTMKKMRKSML